MTGTPQPYGDDGTPPPQRREPLFRVMYEAGLQSVGEPMRQGSGRLRIEITPVQMIRLTQELSPSAIRALMTVIQMGYRPGQRIEIEGWGGPWLRQQGMRKYESEVAAKELREKGYIRPERMPGGNQLGKQLGVVPSGHIEEVEDTPGIPRTDGRPATKPRKGSHGGFRVRETGIPRIEGPTGDDPVDGSDPRSSGIQSPRNPGSRDDENVFPQVSAPFPKSVNRLSTGPTSSGSSKIEEEVFSLPGPGQPLTRHDLTRFFADPDLIAAVTARWEIVVALVARQFVPYATRCAEIVGWLGDGEDEHPETRLAQIVVDLIKTPPHERFDAAAAQETHLRAKSVKFRQTTPDDFLAAFIATTVSALDSTRPIESWGGWYGGGLKRDTQFQGKVFGGVLNVFRSLLSSPETLTDDIAESTPPTSSERTSYSADDPSYVERLRAAAQGTIWDDDISFATLLRNPGQQARLLAQHARRSGES